MYYEEQYLYERSFFPCNFVGFKSTTTCASMDFAHDSQNHEPKMVTNGWLSSAIPENAEMDRTQGGSSHVSTWSVK